MASIGTEPIVDEDKYSTSLFLFSYMRTALFLNAAYIVARKVCFVLEKIPWLQTIRGPIYTFLPVATERKLFISLWYFSKSVKCLLVFALIQGALVVYTVTHKCRWDKVKLELATHYQSTEEKDKPNLTPALELLNFQIICLYIIAVNGFVIYRLYKISGAYNALKRHVENVDPDNDQEIVRIHNLHMKKLPYVAETFAVGWVLFTFGFMMMMTYYESLVFKFFSE